MWFQWIGTKLFPRLRSEKEASAGQLSKPKLEQQLSNRDRPEITNYKHQITNKSQISISNDQNIQRGCTVSLPKFLFAGNYAIWHKCRRIIRLEFWISVFVICLVFVIWIFLIADTWHLQFLTTCCQKKRTKGLTQPCNAGAKISMLKLPPINSLTLLKEGGFRVHEKISSQF
jgi:hypothetical protein